MEISNGVLERLRTSGDGMEEQTNTCKEANVKFRYAVRRPTSATIQENVHKSTNNSSTCLNDQLLHSGLQTLYRRYEGPCSLAPVLPGGKLIQMIPHLVKSAKTKGTHTKNKPPKFIPYEPYTGATSSIVSTPRPKTAMKNKNNLDIGVLVSQMSTMRSKELGDKNSEEYCGNSSLDVKFEKLREELRKITEERDYYQGQFRFQTQVNSELKNLLVASVGEDMQSHVNVLTEDKLQLARALLDTAKNLTTHTEQIEFLASQCEVWRSKFLASSVMVEELARWKADLIQKNQILEESTKRLLHATHQIREMQLEILKNLKFVAKIRYLNLPSTDVINLSAENLNIVHQMVLHSGVGIPEGDIDILSTSKNPLCDAEKYAVKSLQFISQPLMATDEAIKALFGQVQRPYSGINTPS
ncbi:PREDICTED: uncharacterized protein LOC108966302 isoform X2 [Bactrocera latifrons]|nr:PREDICTED: uncharacterized protein LOC108966302 isoform X2 [Bactrocera latifrons]XP_018784677.1 PREDICTED: uncharacterized protein LOC108966302 isoform X2 [Bactrocera latifrons]XP_018784678.1 PREDICTED: uncharacterized protein LOC108966302 isoform X2 [Bactrocera latifrons]XP_018784679.1 PREDICTED: uncharacterized protein LOC108966302 isoform X2 [Bactrocera latifrons]XP_018784680.1 PREDICTED: uncharacterized protein LOC108966302 isoform X2 [Bactrocera latifrons]